MSWTNYLAPQQLRNFKRRARFVACGEPADVFAEPWPYQSHRLFVTINRNTETNDAWFEATHYSRHEDGTYTAEIPAPYVSKCRKVPEADAREIIARELYRWASMPAGTVAGYTPAEIAAEAKRITEGR